MCDTQTCGTNPVTQRMTYSSRVYFSVLNLKDSVCVILESVVEFGREGVDGLLDHGVDMQVQLLLRHVQVEAAFHALHRR